MPRFIPTGQEKLTPLRRRRPPPSSDYVCFGPDRDGFVAYLSREVIAYIQEHLVLSAPNETVGLLAGRPCVDQEGPYTVVCGVENALAEEVEATPGSIRLSGQAQAQIRSRLERSHPTLDLMGWYHTHPISAACFSAEDFQEQKTWPDSHHLGVVAGQVGQRREISAYRGPTGQLLTPAQYRWQDEAAVNQSLGGKHGQAQGADPEQNPHLVIHAVIQGWGGLPPNSRQMIPVEVWLIALLYGLLPALMVGVLVWLLHGGAG